MQLHLETDELNLVANILLERIGKAAHGGLSDDEQLDPRMRLSPRFFEDLADKILARDLRLDSDELEQLSELLRAERRKLAEQVAQQENVELKAQSQRRLGLLDRALERVSEACVMF